MPRRQERKATSKPEAYLIDHNGITPYLNEFIDWSEAMNYSDSTTVNRRHAIRWFIRWCDERGLEQPQDITKPILERYKRHLYHYRKSNGKALSFRTQAGRIQGIKAFFKWLTKQNHILYNPASELEPPRIRRQLPRHLLSKDDIELILKQTQYTNEVGTRDRAVIETLYSTGMRRMEISNLKLYDLDVERGTIFIYEGKGKKDRTVPIGERACAWIKKYIDETRSSLVMEPDEGYLFISDLGKPFHKNQMGDMVKKYILKAGINKPGSCHLFRHAMATHMLENGADIRYIQAILGHSDLSSTQIYTQVSIKKLKEIHTATHPAKLERVITEEQNDVDTEEALLTLLSEEAELADIE
jgi:integrase/recombinase XerD